MDVDAAGGSRKRAADSSLDGAPPTKRAKFADVFCGVFSSIDSVDMNTLKIQNRELLCKLTERKKEMAEVSAALGASEETQLRQVKQIIEIASFLNQLIEDLKSLMSILPATATKLQHISGIDLVKLFRTAEIKAGASDLPFDLIRSHLSELFKEILEAIQSDIEERSKNVVLMSGSNVTEVCKSEIMRLAGEVSVLRQRTDSALGKEADLKSQIVTLTNALKLRQEEEEKKNGETTELKERLERMTRHLARVELEMQSLSDIRRSESPAPVIVTPTGGDSSTSTTLDAQQLSSLVAQQTATLSNELQETKRLSESRLIEISNLRNEKIELLKSGTLPLGGGPLGANSSDSELEQNAKYKHLVEAKKILEAESLTQKDKILALINEIQDIKTAYTSAKEALRSQFEKEGQALQASIDKMTQKLKNMEQDRDKAKHRLSIQESRKTGPTEAEKPAVHFIIMEKHLQDTRKAYETLQKDHQALTEKYEKILAEFDQDVLKGQVESYKTQLKVLQDQVAALTTKQVSNGHPGEGKHHEESKLVLKVTEVQTKLELSQEKLKESLATIEAQKEEIKQLGIALQDLVNDSATAAQDTETLASQVAERDRRIEAMNKSKANSATISSLSKKQLSMDNELQGSAQSEIRQLNLLLESERSSSKDFALENEKLFKECNLLRASLESQSTVATQSTLAINLLAKQISELQGQLAKKDQEVLQAAGKVEEEKGMRMRLDEELGVSKRQISSLKSSTSMLTSSSGITSGSDAESRLRKDLQLYQALFNCALCERARRVDSVISICGHVFCNVCIDEKCIRPRNRKCPKCKKSFGKDDVSSIYF